MMNMLDYCLNAVQRNSLPDVEYRPGGILPSEMLAFISLCREQNVTNVVESGRSLGYSTRILAEAGFHVASIEINPNADADTSLKQFTNVKLHHADGVRLLPSLLQGRCAVILDGPKGVRALDIWESVKKHAVLGAIHDASKRTVEGVNGSRQPIADAGAWFTDDPVYVAATEQFDEPAWRKDYASRSEMTAHGFTLAIFRGEMWTGG